MELSKLILFSIISTVLNWDIKELESRASKLERERATAGKEQLSAVKAYVGRPSADHIRIRQDSGKLQDIVVMLVSLTIDRT